MVSLLNRRANKLKNLFFVICWHVNVVMPRKQKQPKKTCYNPLSPEDLNFIKLIFEEKGWYGAKICREFPSKNWNPVTVNKNIKKLRETGSIHRKPGTGLYDGNRSVCINRGVHPTVQKSRRGEGWTNKTLFWIILSHDPFSCCSGSCY